MDKERILENGTAFLTYASAPYHADHLLVIPKRHFEELSEITDEELKDADNLQKQALQILSKLGHENVSILVRSGKNSGRSIAHLHYNIIPDILLGNVDHGGKDREMMTESEVLDFHARLKSIGLVF